MDLERVLQWPRETWSPEEIIFVEQCRAELHREMVALADEAERWNRSLSDEEQIRYDALTADFGRVSAAISSAS